MKEKLKVIFGFSDSSVLNVYIILNIFIIINIYMLYIIHILYIIIYYYYTYIYIIYEIYSKVYFNMKSRIALNFVNHT